jgi:hypothetical protein
MTNPSKFRGLDTLEDRPVEPSLFSIFYLLFLFRGVGWVKTSVTCARRRNVDSPRA